MDASFQSAATARRLAKIGAFAQAHRPVCALCGKLVEKMFIRTTNRPHTIICTALCHGAFDNAEVTIDDPENVLAFTPTRAFVS